MSRFTYYYAECRYAECHYVECHYVECRGVPNLTRKRQARLEGPATEKHSSLIVTFALKVL